MHNERNVSVFLSAVPLHLHASALALPFLLQPAFWHQSLIPSQHINSPPILRTGIIPSVDCVDLRKGLQPN
jgi:hypothetical protein